MEGKEAIIDSILASARDAAANIVSDAKAERDELVAATVAKGRNGLPARKRTPPCSKVGGSS